MPRVWFYCNSTLQLRVLADALKSLHLFGKINSAWRVAVTFSDDDNADTTFSLEPNLEGERVTLAALQNDVDAIAENLRDAVLATARKLSARDRWSC